MCYHILKNNERIINNFFKYYYDKEGKIVSAKSGYVTPSELGAGSRGSFDVYPDVGKEEIDHWSIQVCCSD
jgi:hypothetical protein